MASEFTRDRTAAAELEQKARDLVERRAGRSFDDAEWKQTRDRLMKFYAIMQAWEERAAREHREQEKY